MCPAIKQTFFLPLCKALLKLLFHFIQPALNKVFLVLSGFTAVLKLCLLFIKNKNIILVPLIYLNMHAWSLLELFIFGVSK